MKNTKSYIFKSLIFSGLVLGTIGLNSTIVNAATDAGIEAATTATTDNKVTNTIVFTSGGAEVGTSATIVQGSKVGQTVDITKLIPKGYQTTSGSNNLTLAADGSAQRIDLVKAGNVTATVHYIFNSGVIGTEEVTGLAGSTVDVAKVPTGYYLVNKNQGSIILGSGSSDVYLNVAQDISNTITFVNDDAAKTEISHITVYGEKAGDKVALSDNQIPNGYSLKDSAAGTITMQPDGSRQQVTVVAKATSEDAKGAVSTFDKVTPLYAKDGTKLDGRSLGAISEWATDKKLTLNGDTYYRVSTSEYVKASDVYSYTPNSATITTKDGSIAPLYDINGKQASRSVAANSAWYTDRTTTINGQTYYRVSTEEWLSAADVK